MPPKGAPVYGPGEHFVGYEDLTSDEEVAETPEEFQALIASASARTRENIFQAGRAVGPPPSKPSSARTSGGVAGGAAGGAAAGNKAQKKKQNAPVKPAAAAAPMAAVSVVKKEDGSEAMPQSKKLLKTWPYCRGVEKKGDCEISEGGNARAWKWHRCAYCLAKKLNKIRLARGTVRRAVVIRDGEPKPAKMIQKSAKMVRAEHAQEERNRKWGDSKKGKWTKQKDATKLQEQKQSREARKQQREFNAAAAAEFAAADASPAASAEFADEVIATLLVSVSNKSAGPSQPPPPRCQSNAAGKMPADAPAVPLKKKRRTLAEVQRKRRDKEHKSSKDGEGSSQPAKAPQTPTQSKKPREHADDEAEESEAAEGRSSPQFHNIGSGKKNMRSIIMTAEMTAQVASGEPARLRNGEVVKHGILHWHPRTGLPHKRFMPFSGDVDMADEDLPGPQKRDRAKVCEERDAKKQKTEERAPSPEY